MKTIILFFALATAALAADAPPGQPSPPTIRELELQKALVDTSLNLMQFQFKDLQDQSKKLGDELEKRKAAEKK